MQRWRALGFLATMAILLGGLGLRAQLGAPTARAAQTWAVQVGADVDQNNGVIANAYFPNAITIDAGDTVSWSFPALIGHTVTFDNGTVPPLAAAVVVDPSAGTADISGQINPHNVSGASPVFDPKLQISSGAPLDPPDERTPFTLSFNQPGVYRYECAIHGAAMSGEVTVLPSGATLPETPAQATARGKAELAGAVGDNAGFFEANPAATVGASPASTVHQVSAGAAAGDGISLLQFLNKDISVHRGDTVVWTSADPAEAHTITFLSGGTEPEFLHITPQTGGLPKFGFAGNIFSPVGGTTYSGQGYLNSGFIFDGSSFAARIDAPPGTYQYVCLIHAVGFPYNMTGTVTVAP